MKLERRIWRIGTFVTVLLVLLSTRLVYWQMIRGAALQPVALDLFSPGVPFAPAAQPEADRSLREALRFLIGETQPGNADGLPQPVVQRTIDLLANIQRGAIYDRNGRLLASENTTKDGDRSRYYAEPSLAHVIGHVSGLGTGIAGLELSYNPTLLGLDRPMAQLERLIHQPITGSDLILTIDSRIQREAEEALGNRPGSVVVLDGKTGAVLAMASMPRYDPNRIQEIDYVANLLQDCGDGQGCNGLFLNRATQALYPPGSTWKTVTLIAALDSGLVSEATIFDFGKPVRGPNGSYYVYRVDGGVIPDPNHSESKLNLEMSYAKSANAAFARMADEMGADTLTSYASRLGFSNPQDQHFALEIPFIASQLASNIDALHANNLLRAATGIGQGELLASPLNMGMVVLSVLNAGDLPIPYLVENVRSPAGALSYGRVKGRVTRNIMQEDTADLVKQMMVTTVERGSGGTAKVSGVKVGGKTGTAQVGGSARPHAWFMGFAEKDGRSVAIAVVLENAGEGSQAAGPVFARVANVAIRQMGDPVQEVVPRPRSLIPAQESAARHPLPTAEITWDETEVGATLQGRGACQATEQGLQGSGDFQWPSRNQSLAGKDFKKRHPGIDIQAPSGTPVYAADAGVVVFAGWAEYGYGNTVLIDHGNGYHSLYGHLSQASTTCGASLEAGALLGLSGNTGATKAQLLHFEIRVPDGFLNPLTMLPRRTP